MKSDRSIRISGLTLVLALIGQTTPACFAAEVPWSCNARRVSGVESYAKRNPEFEKKCYATGIELLENAIGHDHNLNEAEGVFETLLRLYPDSAYALIGYAELEIRKRELQLPAAAADRIREFAERATRVKPVVPDSYMTLSRADLLVGCLPCAEKSLSLAQKLGASGTALPILQSLIADLRGDARGAESRLTGALAAAALRPETRSRLHLALSAHYVRSKSLNDADRELGNAISAVPQNVTAYVRRAELLLYLRGDAVEAAKAADKANAVAVTLAAKRVRSISEYLVWSRDYLAGRPWEYIKRIAQVSLIPPDEVFVLGARYASLSDICVALLKARIVREIDVRDSEGNTALIAAAKGGNASVARQLLARRADVNAQNSRAERALSWFVRNGSKDVVMLLLKAGAEINYMDNDGDSPLSVAVQQRDALMVVELMQRRTKTSGGGIGLPGDLLAAAALTDDINTLKALLDGGLKVDSPDRHGASALLTAVTWGNKMAVKLLLERGARPEAAMDIARRFGNHEILDMLRAASKQLV